MTPMTVIPPAALSVDPSTGRMANATRHYEKRFKDLSGLYADAAAYAAMLLGLSDVVVYDVWEHRASEAPGDLVFGTSVMRPGCVGDEFFFTRGHQHQVADRSEVYHCLAGTGVMLMEHPKGEVRALPMAPQAIVYVPPHWIHRSVNTGADALITVFCYAADAGQDYGVIENAGGMRARVVRDGAGGWKLADNPGWRSRG
jgi:glucose-6-phosphate isomerase, archaeal